MHRPFASTAVDLPLFGQRDQEEDPNSGQYGAEKIETALRYKVQNKTSEDTGTQNPR